MRKNVLLVEGPNDGSAISGLLQKKSIEIPNFSIIVCGGIDQLPKKLDLYLKNNTAYEIIGIVVDADSNVNSRWQQVRDRLTKTGKYACNKMVLNENGMIIEPIESEDAKVGVWIMPDNKYQGALEDFLLEMISPKDKLLEEVERELFHLEAEKMNSYKEKDRSKAKIHNYLSWEKYPGCSLNTAIISRVLDSNTKLAYIFIDWIRKLFLGN